MSAARIRGRRGEVFEISAARLEEVNRQIDQAITGTDSEGNQAS